MKTDTSTWESTKLGDAGRWLSGGTPSTGNPDYWGGQIPWISSGSLTNFRLRDSDRRVTRLGANSGTRLVPPGTILMVVRGMSLKTEFRLGIAQREMAFGQDCKALVARSDIDPTFLAYSIAARQQVILGLVDEAGHGTGRLNSDQLFGVEILLPPRVEQRGIAEVLEALDDKIAANVKLALTAADIVSANYDLARHGDTVTPTSLSELVRTQYGVTTSATSGDGPRLLRVTDINKKPWIEWSGAPACAVNASDRAKYGLSEGDILVARMADPGKAAYIDADDPEAVFASYLVRLTPHNPDVALYIYYFLRSSEYQRYAEGASTGSVQRNMNAKVIVAAEISLPPDAVLQQFNASARALRATIRSHLQENARLAAMRDALLPQLMSGKIRVKDAERVVEGVV